MSEERRSTEARGLRQIGVIDFEGGGFVRVQATNDIATSVALDALQEIISRKRQELERSGRVVVGD